VVLGRGAHPCTPWSNLPLRLSLGFRQFALVFPVLYGIVFPFLSFPARTLNIHVLLPIHLFVMCCLFYVFTFVAKSLVLQHETRYVVFRDYASWFLLMWFFPFTVCWVQPRISGLYRTQPKGH
jgi:hypothetical protein